MARAGRALTEPELAILDLVQKEYGPQNTSRDVEISPADEAVLWVKDREGSTVLVVVLTNVAEWSQLDGLSEDEIVQQYLRPHESEDAPSQSSQPPIRYHGRGLAMIVVTFVIPATLVQVLAKRTFSIWSLVPGVGGAILIMGVLYFKWWREGRLG